MSPHGALGSAETGRAGAVTLSDAGVNREWEEDGAVSRGGRIYVSIPDLKRSEMLRLSGDRPASDTSGRCFISAMREFRAESKNLVSRGFEAVLRPGLVPPLRRKRLR